MSIYEYNEEEHMRMEREDAFEDGRKEGQEAERTKIFELISKMTADGMADQILRLAKEPVFYEEMMKKYNL